MQQKDFRTVFALLLAMCAGLGFLFTATTMVEPGGIALVFRIVVCIGAAVGFVALFALDLFGIWTGHLPQRRKH